MHRLDVSIKHLEPTVDASGNRVRTAGGNKADVFRCCLSLFNTKFFPQKARNILA